MKADRHDYKVVITNLAQSDKNVGGQKWKRRK